MRFDINDIKNLKNINKEKLDEITAMIQQETERYLEDRERLKERARQNPDQARKENIAVVITILAFIGFIVLLTVCMATRPILCMSCFGVLIAIFTTMAIVQHGISWESWYVALFPVIGVVLTALPIIEVVHQKNTGETIFTKRFIITVMTIIFTVVGLIMIIEPIAKRLAIKKICTHPVMATCIFLKVKEIHDENGRSILFAPKWEYSLGGKAYEYQEKEYSNISVPNIGERRELMINPDDPEQAYRKNPGTMALFIGGGLACLAFSAIMIYFEFIR